MKIQFKTNAQRHGVKIPRGTVIDTDDEANNWTDADAKSYIASNDAELVEDPDAAEAEADVAKKGKKGAKKADETTDAK